MKIPPLKKTYASRTVLNTPELELEKGKIYAVLGSNGSGKSTLARLAAGIIQSDDRKRITGFDVAYMPQKNYAFRMSTRANIMLGGNDGERCSKLMKALRIEQLADKPAYRLSGGETARMALARLLMKEHELVILDEPTAAMDMESTILSEELLCDYCQSSNCALLLVTHSIQQAKRIADRVFYLDKGELIEAGEKDAVLYSPSDPRTRRFLDFYGM